MSWFFILNNRLLFQVSRGGVGGFCILCTNFTNNPRRCYYPIFYPTFLSIFFKIKNNNKKGNNNNHPKKNKIKSSEKKNRLKKEQIACMILFLLADTGESHRRQKKEEKKRGIPNPPFSLFIRVTRHQFYC